MKILLLFFVEETQKGNTIENKGNTTEDTAISRVQPLVFSPFFVHKGNTQKATPIGRTPL
jgi:hypothetical protein